jgi:hypothetical protein
MASLNLKMCTPATANNRLYCLLRRRWVKATPEEAIRQQLLHRMLTLQGYPRGLIAVEVALQQLVPPGTHVPSRRIDIACYTSVNGQLIPLLVIECKAVPLTTATLRQVSGYNYYLAAPYLAIANATAIYTGWRAAANGDYQFIAELPSYQILLQHYKSAA